MSASQSQKSAGPFKLVTVNTAPERAFRLIGRVTEELKPRYTIHHAENCSSIEEVAGVVERVQPDILCCASMWSPEESGQIIEIARSKAPQVKTYAIPQGLQVEEGPDAIVEHLSAKLPAILDSVAK